MSVAVWVVFSRVELDIKYRVIELDDVESYWVNGCVVKKAVGFKAGTVRVQFLENVGIRVDTK